MIITKFESREEWLDARQGKITGTKVEAITPKVRPSKEMYGDKREGWFDLLAEKLSIRTDSENEYEKAMDRGNRLEEEAIDKFTEKTGIEMCKDRVIWTRDDNENIASSPDGYSLDLTSAVEAKCLGQGKHAKAMLLNEMPSDYHYQALQYFVVNEKLETLYFVMYDPRFIVNQLLIFTITRAEMQDEVATTLEVERRALEDIDALVKKIIAEAK
jgi:putative phage-type endonuclease